MRGAEKCCDLIRSEFRVILMEGKYRPASRNRSTLNETAQRLTKFNLHTLLLTSHQPLACPLGPTGINVPVTKLSLHLHEGGLLLDRTGVLRTLVHRASAPSPSGLDSWKCYNDDRNSYDG